MADPKHIDSPELVTSYIQNLDPVVAEKVEAIRQVILSADKDIGEQIKWNSPSFFYKGEMKPFDPKEYKREIAVMNLFRKEFVLIVIPGGAKVNDTTGFLEGDYKDGRRLVKIFNLQDLKSKEKALKKVIRDWVKLVDK
jgi:hypothetical protein